ncbi:MAG: hypothetical protein ACT4QG_05970 [Sporichthyaceae bacterium]
MDVSSGEPGPTPEPETESALPRVPVWPLYLAVLVALGCAVVYLANPTRSTLWIAASIGGVAVVGAFGWHSLAARRAGYGKPDFTAAGDAFGNVPF